MFNNILPETDGERAVSPVIGVILMVAITVILAAVIGTFVLGLGDQVSQTAPQATISVEEYTNGVTDRLVLRHGGGDDIVAGETDVVIGGDAPVSGFTLSGSDANNTDATISTATDLVIGSDGTQTVTSWDGTGVGYGGSTNFSMNADSTLEVTLVDTGSGQIIAEKSVDT